MQRLERNRRKREARKKSKERKKSEAKWAVIDRWVAILEKKEEDKGIFPEITWHVSEIETEEESYDDELPTLEELLMDILAKQKEKEEENQKLS